MATKRKKTQEGAVRFLLCSLLSIAAAIASVGLFFAKWVTVVGETYSVPQFYRAATTLQTELAALREQFAAWTIEVPATLSNGVERVRIAAIVVMALAAVIALLQVVYLFKTLFGSGGRPVGVAAGVLTAVLALGAVAALFWMNSSINNALSPVNEWLSTVDSAYNGFSGTLSDLFPSLNLGTVELQIDANDIIKTTVFPYVTAALGAVEAIFAR